jgi:hypothetical protein
MQFRKFKIKKYGSMDKDMEAVTAHLQKGGIMVGSFPISRNYFSPIPWEVYVYDPDKAIRHEKSGLAASHVAMMIGIGHRLTLWCRTVRAICVGSMALAESVRRRPSGTSTGSRLRA